MVVLGTKLYVQGDARQRSLDSLRSLLDNDLGDLDVTYDLGVRDDDFPAVMVEGPDAVVARNVLREAWGELTTHVEDGQPHVGTLASWDDDGFVLDTGHGLTVRVPTDGLGLGRGSPDQIRTRFGIVQHLPLEFVFEDGTARLTDAQRDRLYDWTRGTGRVNVNSATRAQVRATVNRAGHAQDIVTVERLGLLEQSIVCPEETDPPGLLASIGEYLSSELLAVVP